MQTQKVGLIMENVNENTENTSVETETETTENNDVITMSTEDFNKKIQSETDKVRTEYSKRIKGLEAKIKELTPIEKSEAELDLENRIKNLEAKERKINMLESLKTNNLSSDFYEYLKADVDVAEFAKIFNAAVSGEVQNQIKANSYVPAGHKSGESLTKDDFKKMNMADREKLFNENPDLYRTLAGR